MRPRIVYTQIFMNLGQPLLGEFKPVKKWFFYFIILLLFIYSNYSTYPRKRTTSLQEITRKEKKVLENSCKLKKSEEKSSETKETSINCDQCDYTTTKTKIENSQFKSSF